MIAGIKLVYAISNCPTISDEDKIKALDDIIDMVKTNYIKHVLCERDESTRDIGILKSASTESSGAILTGSFWFSKSKLGDNFWFDVVDALYETNS